jgi:hypothetical protein
MSEPESHLPLRVDILSNLQFFEYEEMMLGLLDQVKKINIGADESCNLEKRNVFASVEDEIYRLWGLKLHAWKVQVRDTELTLPPLQTGPFREIDTGTRYVAI